MAGEKSNEDAPSRAAEKNARKKNEPAHDVMQWMEEVHHGTLSTLSCKDDLEGFPIGSIVPFAVDVDGMPYILIAEIAAHTKNLINSNKMNLFISHPEPKGDPQSFWRASIVGSMKRVVSSRKMESFDEQHLNDCLIVSEEQEQILLARYAERVPNARQYLNVHNFSFWKIDSIEKVRYIAGFGRICWIEGHEMTPTVDEELLESKAYSIEHMNEDHEDSMVTLCEGAHGFKPEGVEMLDLDSRGILMRTRGPEQMIFSSFGKIIKASDLRVEIVKLIKKARANIPSEVVAE
jgi:hypothetical protein